MVCKETCWLCLHFMDLGAQLCCDLPLSSQERERPFALTVSGGSNHGAFFVCLCCFDGIIVGDQSIPVSHCEHQERCWVACADQNTPSLDWPWGCLAWLAIATVWRPFEILLSCFPKALAQLFMPSPLYHVGSWFRSDVACGHRMHRLQSLVGQGGIHFPPTISNHDCCWVVDQRCLCECFPRQQYMTRNAGSGALRVSIFRLLYRPCIPPSARVFPLPQYDKYTL